MLRDDASDGEVYEPSTVATSVTVDCMSTFAYLFAIDFKRAQIVWLNKGINGDVIVAGETGFDAIDTLLDACDIINMYDLASLLAREVVDDPGEADVVFSDDEMDLHEGQEQIHSNVIERIIALLNS